jgi:lipopolysaccharide transport system ATP-binding protein
VERFLDTPVKRYSSGMYVRLAFSVAAPLEPEILIVDEVLAVGDAGFQRKCLDKMRECASSGRTVILVSHQMSSVRDLCHQAVWMAAGSVRMAGPVSGILEQYLTHAGSHIAPGDWSDLSQVPRTGAGLVQFRAAMCYGLHPDTTPAPDGPFHLTARLWASAGASRDIRVEFQLLDRFQTKLLAANTFDRQGPLRLHAGMSDITFVLDQLHLAPGIYTVSLLVGDASDLHDVVSDALRIEVVPLAEVAAGNWSHYSLVTRSFRCEVCSPID